VEGISIYRQEGQQKEPEIKCLKRKSFPNYIFVVLIGVSVILLVTTIVVGVIKSSSSSEGKNNELGKGGQPGNGGGKQGNGDEEEDVSTLTPWEKYKKAEKYLYIWEYYTSDYIIKMCQEHHFTRVYLSIGCIETFWEKYYSKGKFPASGEIGDLDYETFIKQLNEINVEVELVTFLAGNGDDFSEVERVDKVANMVKELAKKVKIKALHFDQESSEDSIENLLNMYIRVDKIFPASAILRPFYLTRKLSNYKDKFKDKSFYEKFSDCETFADALLKITKFSDLMAYNKDYTQVESYMEQLKEINSRHTNNEAKNIIEIGWGRGVPEDDTLHERYVEDKDKFFNFVYDMSKKYNGITIHYFEKWYETLYCTWPKANIPYDGGEPKECTYSR